MNVGQLMSELKRMTVGELKARYAEVFGEPTRSNHKEFLIRRIAWRAQANEEGGLPERARKRAHEIANDADLRTRAPGKRLLREEVQATALPSVTVPISATPDSRLPMPGALLTRVYRGQTINVRVLPKGFDYEGTIYRSLSAVAKAVTGAHWNGYLFFGIAPPGPTPAPMKAPTDPVQS